MDLLNKKSLYKGKGLFIGKGLLTALIPPNISDALLWLDGTISSDEFVDKSGSNRNFTITNNDIELLKGFPYKSAATISAPIGDATLIAADINNFLYDSGGNPNEIPVVSFFQDIDYEHKLFCKHKDQGLDSNGVEIYEPRIVDVVLYNTVKSGSDLIVCQNYYGVPVEITSNVRWVDPINGLNGNTGTKISPWQTEVKVEISGLNGDIAYTKTGVSKEDPYWFPSKTITYTALGFTIIQANNVTYLFRPLITNIFSGFIFDGEGSVGNIFLGGNARLNRCLIKNTVNGSMFTLVGNVVELNNCILDSSSFGRRFLSGDDFTISNSFLNMYFTPATSGHIYTLLNNKIVIESIPAITSWLRLNHDSEVIIKGGSFQIDASYAIIYCDYIKSTTKDLNISYVDITVIDAGLSLFFILTGGFMDIIFDNVSFVNDSAHSIFENRGASNFNITNSIIDNTVDGGDLLMYSLEVVETIINVENCLTISRGSVSYGVGTGTETTHAAADKITDIVITKGRTLGQRHFTPSASNISHGLFVGFNATNHDLSYYSVEGHGIGVVLKGSNSNYVNSKLKYCQIFNSALEGVFFKGVDNANAYNLTLVNNVIEFLYGENTGSDGSTGETVKNCIAINEGGYLHYMSDVGSSTGHNIDYNVYYSDVEKPFRIVDTEYTFSEWQALGHDENSIMLSTLEEAKALFIDYDNNNFRLSANSQAKGVGIYIEVYKTGLDESTNWGDLITIPSVITKDQNPSSVDIGAYVT